MFKKLTLAAAAGAGYVLGAKAGKERYAQIESKFREVAGMPAVQNATTAVKESASSAADTAKAKATETVDSVSSKAKGGSKADTDVVVDLGTTPVTPPPSTLPPVTPPPSTTTVTGSTSGSTPPVVTRP